MTEFKFWLFITLTLSPMLIIGFLAFEPKETECQTVPVIERVITSDKYGDVVYTLIVSVDGDIKAVGADVNEYVLAETGYSRVCNGTGKVTGVHSAWFIQLAEEQ